MESQEKQQNKYKCLKIHGKRIDEHRLIAMQYWGEDAVRGNDVHHKNGIKNVNRIENLELLPRSVHARNHMLGHKLSLKTKEKIGLHSRKYWKDRTSDKAKKIVQETLSGIPIVQFESAYATASYGYDDTAINKCCIGRLKSYHNFKWRFVGDDELINVPLLKRIGTKSYKRKTRFHGRLPE